MSRESTEQGKSGRRGVEASRTSGEGKQARQGSGRTEVYGSGVAEPKHHFDAGHAPSEQGEEGHPSPSVIKQRQQGLSGSGTGHQGGKDAHSDRSEEIASRGEPSGRQVRHGRQHLPGDRSREERGKP